MAKIDYGELCDCLKAACDREPIPYDYSAWVDWTETEHASDNKYLLANATQVVLGKDLPKCAQWSKWFCRQPLHEDETLTGSGSYRKAIDCSTHVIGVALIVSGYKTDGEAVLARCRASMAHFGLGMGSGVPRAVVDHGTPGVPCVTFGDGERRPLSGDPAGKTPFIAIAGMRSRVRARVDDVVNGSHFVGPFEYTEAEEQRAMVAQLLGHPYNAKRYSFEHSTWTWCRKKNPQGKPFGCSPEDVEAVRASIRGRSAATLSALSSMAMDCLPALTVHYDFYDDGSIFVWMPELHDSSTGGTAICGQRGPHSGITAFASADNGSRGKDDVQRQLAWEDGNRYFCQWAAGGPVLSVLKPLAKLVSRVTVSPGGVVVDVGPGVDPPVVIPPPPASGPTFPLDVAWYEPGKCWVIRAHTEAPVRVDPTHADTDAPQRWTARLA